MLLRSADVYVECPDWAALGYCAWMWVIADPDTSEVMTVPDSCQDSCGVCGAPSSAATTLRRRRGRSLLGRSGKKSAGSQEPQLSNAKVKGGDSWKVRRGQVPAQAGGHGQGQQNVCVDASGRNLTVAALNWMATVAAVD